MKTLRSFQLPGGYELFWNQPSLLEVDPKSVCSGDRLSSVQGRLGPYLRLPSPSGGGVWDADVLSLLATLTAGGNAAGSQLSPVLGLQRVGEEATLSNSVVHTSPQCFLGILFSPPHCELLNGMTC